MGVRRGILVQKLSACLVQKLSACLTARNRVKLYAFMHAVSEA